MTKHQEKVAESARKRAEEERALLASVGDALPLEVTLPSADAVAADDEGK